jgi:hypothetical protein
VASAHTTAPAPMTERTTEQQAERWEPSQRCLRVTPDMTPDTTRRITAVPDMTRRITAAPDTTRRITTTPDTTRRITAVLDTTRRITVVLDPPRTGLAPSVCKALRAESAIDRIVFVSCNPHGHTLRHDYVVKGGSLAANTRPTPRYFASAVLGALYSQPCHPCRSLPPHAARRAVLVLREGWGRRCSAGREESCESR